MEKRQAFCFELMPNGAQLRAMHQFAGMTRFVYNKALETQQANYAKGEKHASHFTMNNWLPSWKAQFPWLKKAPSQALQAALGHLNSAYVRFFETKIGFPQFKKRGLKDSFTFPQGFELDESNARIRLPKIGWIRYRKSQSVQGTIKNVTCSYKAGAWFISMQTEETVAQPVPTATKAVGIDVGVANFAALSDGTFVAPLNSFRKHEKRLARYQRRMSRKVKGSQNYKKARAKVSRCHHTIANARNDFLHKLSRQIANDHAMVVMEDLNISGMTKAAKKSSKAAKRGLNKAILDQGWGEFKRQLTYKLAWNGGLLVEVPAAYTSQMCSACGHVHKENRKTQNSFTCVACGHHDHADLNAAKNILAAGHAVFACRGHISQPTLPLVASPTKQEPDKESLSLTTEASVGIPIL